jgi:hypothetical protein
VVNKLLESISAAFMLTAAAYAAGVVQSKQLYRELGVEAELVSIDFQKSLYDGGLIVFSELAKNLTSIVPYFIGLLVILILASCFKKFRAWVSVYQATVVGFFSFVLYLTLLWVIYDVTVSSFAEGRKVGGELALHLKKVCTMANVKYEGGAVLRVCTIGRTSDLLWFYDPRADRAVAFGKDKILKIDSVE